MTAEQREQIEQLEAWARQCLDKDGVDYPDWWSRSPGEDFHTNIYPSLFLALLAERREDKRQIELQRRQIVILTAAIEDEIKDYRTDGNEEAAQYLERRVADSLPPEGTSNAPGT